MADESTGPGPGTDDEWDRQLRALTEGSAGQARFRELSAAQRAKEGARRAKEARKQAARDALRAERASRRAAAQPSLARRWLLGSLIILVAVAIVTGLFWLSLGRALRVGPNDTQPARGTASSGTPTGAPTSASPRASRPAPSAGRPPAHSPRALG